MILDLLTERVNFPHIIGKKDIFCLLNKDNLLSVCALKYVYIYIDSTQIYC